MQNQHSIKYFPHCIFLRIHECFRSQAHRIKPLFSIMGKPNFKSIVVEKKVLVTDAAALVILLYNTYFRMQVLDNAMYFQIYSAPLFCNKL
ncbi:hypothetical protein GDO81_010757 [Engystomops pustulosus]|uniref:Uncharacterized protein n=1 Tax=Engystomops pustulosus TaxID=76066 RepID=A0AAV7C3K5_ENGPU|nr:hypothetical protein GDO81_010757 [Engystomops pustulosus]